VAIPAVAAGLEDLVGEVLEAAGRVEAGRGRD